MNSLNALASDFGGAEDLVFGLKFDGPATAFTGLAVSLTSETTGVGFGDGVDFFGPGAGAFAGSRLGASGSGLDAVEVGCCSSEVCEEGGVLAPAGERKIGSKALCRAIGFTSGTRLDVVSIPGRHPSSTLACSSSKATDQLCPGPIMTYLLFSSSPMLLPLGPSYRPTTLPRC